jgi:hypothetical protein
MGNDPSAESPAPANPYAWWLQLRVPSEEERRAGQLNMTASEQMFFVGAPLAHVVQYEEYLRAKQRRGLPCVRKHKARFPLDEESARRGIALHQGVVR